MFQKKCKMKNQRLTRIFEVCGGNFPALAQHFSLVCSTHVHMKTAVFKFVPQKRFVGNFPRKHVSGMRRKHRTRLLIGIPTVAHWALFSGLYSYFGWETKAWRWRAWEHGCSVPCPNISLFWSPGCPFGSVPSFPTYFLHVYRQYNYKGYIYLSLVSM